MNKEKFDYVGTIRSLLTPLNCSPQVEAFIACQFALESNYGSSRLATCYSNHCGMSLVHYRITTDVNCSGRYAHYTSLSSCVLDYMLWLAYNKFHSVELFDLELFKSRLVGANYCPEKDYIERIIKIYNDYVETCKLYE